MGNQCTSCSGAQEEGEIQVRTDVASKKTKQQAGFDINASDYE